MRCAGHPENEACHDGYNREKQAVKMADVFGIEKVWGSIYESNRAHGDFRTRRSNFNMIGV